MATNRKTSLLKNRTTCFGALLLITGSMFMWLIFLLVQKPKSYIIACISAMIYMVYIILGIILMEKI